uniref:Protein kinase domain-containing protein n=1 Tax=Tetradesmus obliquus TaxID=3088 RepID=A0A383VIC2_TETOB|eukprot:jgi/Sobl393_1/8504/SZX65265.1
MDLIGKQQMEAAAQQQPEQQDRAALQRQQAADFADLGTNDSAILQAMLKQIFGDEPLQESAQPSQHRELGLAATGEQHGRQYNQQYGQQYGQQYLWQYGQQYGQWYGQQYDQQYGQQLGQQYVQQHEQRCIQQPGQYMAGMGYMQEQHMELAAPQLLLLQQQSGACTHFLHQQVPLPELQLNAALCAQHPLAGHASGNPIPAEQPGQGELVLGQVAVKAFDTAASIKKDPERLETMVLNELTALYLLHGHPSVVQLLARGMMPKPADTGCANGGEATAQLPAATAITAADPPQPEAADAPVRCIVEELAECSVLDRLTTHSPMPEQQVQQHMRSLVELLQHMHSRSIKS